MKGLKRRRDLEAADEGVEEQDDIISEVEDTVEGGVDVKRAKLE